MRKNFWTDDEPNEDFKVGCAMVLRRLCEVNVFEGFKNIFVVTASFRYIGSLILKATVSWKFVSIASRVQSRRGVARKERSILKARAFLKSVARPMTGSSDVYGVVSRIVTMLSCY